MGNLRLYPEISPDFETFCEMAKKGNLVPVFTQLLADLETPVSSLLKLAHSSKYAFLLESVEGQEKIGRYSFLSADPAMVFKSKDKTIELTNFEDGKITKKEFLTKTSPLDEIRNIMARYRFVHHKDLPRYCGGLVGYMAYDMVRFFEAIPDKNKDDLGTADSIFVLAKNIVVFDHVEHKIKIVVNVFTENQKSVAALKRAYNQAIKQIDGLYARLSKSLVQKPATKENRQVSVESNMTKQEFCNAVTKAKDYIRKGDIIQTVLSQRFKVNAADSPISIYRRLRSINPSPYMFYLKFDDFCLVGSSPEMLIRCEDGIVETRPIAGTRPRGKDEADDERLAVELLNDKKERAEHLMLVDLGRNDLGRVAQSGTVEIPQFMTVEKYSHVMHLVSFVKAKLDKKHDIFDALSSAFPAGTLSGAPKVRAMEIIDELENVRRGPYGGCVGYFSFSGNLDTCITIRTILIKGAACYVQAGAGIVADSVPETEFKETQNKAKALIEAITKDISPGENQVV